MRFICPMCDNAVDIYLCPSDGEEVSVIEVLCATRHPKPVKMDEVDEFPEQHVIVKYDRTSLPETCWCGVIHMTGLVEG